MNGHPGTKIELTALRTAINVLDQSGLVEASGHLESLYRKLTTRTLGGDGAKCALLAGTIERALVAASGGRVIALDADAGTLWARSLAKKIDMMKVTEAQAGLVGRWLASQPWAANRQFTLDRILMGWPSYLARAKQAGPESPAQDWRRKEYGDATDAADGVVK